MKEQASLRADEVVLLVDSSKLGPAGVRAWIPLDPSWTLLTDAGVSPETAGAFEAKGVRVLTAG